MAARFVCKPLAEKFVIAAGCGSGGICFRVAHPRGTFVSALRAVEDACFGVAHCGGRRGGQALFETGRTMPRIALFFCVLRKGAFIFCASDQNYVTQSTEGGADDEPHGGRPRDVQIVGMR